MSDIVTIEDVRAARERLKGLIAATPCPYSETLSELTGSRVFVKLENLQMTGSFKERGAASGPDHTRSIKKHLQSAGYTVEEVLHR